GAWPWQRTARATRSCTDNLTFRSQRQRLSFLRRGVAPRPTSLESNYFQKLMQSRQGGPDGRSPPPAEKWAVCIGATAPSQADMGIKARWRKHFRGFRRSHTPMPAIAWDHAGSSPSVRISRFDASPRVNAMNASAAGCRARTEIPAAYVMTFCNSAGSGPTNSMLHADFRLAPGNELCHRSAGEFALGSDLLGDAKLCQQTRNIGAARSVAKGKRASLQERLPQCGDAADVRLRRPSSD